MQTIDRDVASDLHLTVADGERVVEHGIVGEVAHGKAVEPLQRTEMPLGAFDELDANLTGKHESYFTTEDAEGTEVICLSCGSQRLLVFFLHGLKMFESFADAERVHLAASIFAGLDRPFEIVAGDLDS